MDRSPSGSNSSSRSFYLLGICALALAGSAAAYFVYWPEPGLGKTRAPTPERAPVPVQTATVAKEDLPVVRSGLGIVSPLTAVDVKVRVDGQLQHIVFSEGQDVKAGDILAAIDPRPYAAAVAQAQADYNKELAQLEQAKIDETRAQKLTTTGSGTTQAAQTAAAQVKVMDATAAAGKAVLDTAKLNLEFATVTAPISGRVGLRQQQEGGIVRAADATGVVTVTQMRPIAVEFTLTQDDLPDLITGQAKGQLSVSAYSREGTKHLADGKLSAIDSQVDSSTGMVKLKAVFANDELTLWPGELVTANITLRTDPNSTVVPLSAIQNGQTGPYVFIVKPGNKVSTASVTTGNAYSGLTAITQGVSIGETVVTSGQSRLVDGTVVSTKGSDGKKLAAAGEDTVQ
ncbi:MULTISPECIES: efflux RND transporter periplasmic adaptor subunit [Rhizobium]|uniref:Membrane fusion protein, multidrug efflux system n=1 Tax=Rhizobium miluonense TaxID=411945 RepID=A0A1C3WR64_9HYPH|nr:efflux RND transporter periplasmic adaptor subunit [Rhizobium miluonense]SCB42461.1 membrane fusion protein, multidrug efflux system [Rhizobium miluonense]